jgi:hypothetical protein
MAKFHRTRWPGNPKETVLESKQQKRKTPTEYKEECHLPFLDCMLFVCSIESLAWDGNFEVSFFDILGKSIQTRALRYTLPGRFSRIKDVVHLLFSSVSLI